MGTYNKIDRRSRKAISYEGGEVYIKTLEDEWVNMLFSFLLQTDNDGYYESVKTKEARYVNLTEQMIAEHGPAFVGKAAKYARNVLGMRSVSELTAALLNKYQFEGKRQFYASYFKRPDGVGEVFAAIDAYGDKRSHALVRGVADYLETLSAYQVGKYNMQYHKYTLHDIINITHPKSDVLNRFQKHELELPDTWEFAIHKLHGEARELEWKRLVEEEKLGYLALLRNLRNILKCSFVTRPWISQYLTPQLTDPVKIRKSLVTPYQIYTAWKVTSEYAPAELELALENAFCTSTSNIPEFAGKTLIVLDVSASMNSPFSTNSVLTLSEVSAVYAAAFLAANRQNSVVDFMKFGTHAERRTYNVDSMGVFKVVKHMQDVETLGHGTNFYKVMDLLSHEYVHYDRIILFSDMQVMTHDHKAAKLLAEYRNTLGPCHLYSFDLGNYHTQIESNDANITYITALNDAVFDTLNFRENCKESLIDVIKNYEG